MKPITEVFPEGSLEFWRERSRYFEKRLGQVTYQANNEASWHEHYEHLFAESEETCESLRARITELEAARAALRIELDGADGAGQELMAENEALRTKLVSVIAGFEYTLEMNKKLSDDLATALRRIPVDDDHLPPRGVRVRVWINGTESIARYSWVVPQWETIDGLYYHGDSLNHVTHWQPIPEYPEDGET